MRLPRVNPGTGYCIPDQVLSFSLAFQSCQGISHSCVSFVNRPRYLYKKEHFKPNENPPLGISPLSVYTAIAPSHAEENTNAKGG